MTTEHGRAAKGKKRVGSGFCALGSLLKHGFPPEFILAEAGAGMTSLDASTTAVATEHL